MSFVSDPNRLLLAIFSTLLSLQATAAPGELRELAHEYYEWRDAAYPVATSSAGEHRFDSRLTDYRMSAVLDRRQHVSELLAQVAAINDENWDKDDRVDRVLFQSQLAYADFFDRDLNPEGSDPQLYVNECSNAIFSLLQKDYASSHTRALAATARLEKIPALLVTARANLTQPVKLYASLAIEAARGGDDLYTASLMTLADQLSASERRRFIKARDNALKALHGFADWLDSGLGKMPEWQPMGEAKYNYLLKHVLLLPFDAALASRTGLIGEQALQELQVRATVLFGVGQRGVELLGRHRDAQRGEVGDNLFTQARDRRCFCRARRCFFLRTGFHC